VYQPPLISTTTTVTATPSMMPKSSAITDWRRIEIVSRQMKPRAPKELCVSRGNEFAPLTLHRLATFWSKRQAVVVPPAGRHHVCPERRKDDGPGCQEEMDRRSHGAMVAPGSHRRGRVAPEQTPVPDVAPGHRHRPVQGLGHDRPLLNAGAGGRQPLDGRLVVWAHLYGQAVRSTHEAVRARDDRAQGMNRGEERPTRR
jgi:hypothetical protein